MTSGSKSNGQEREGARPCAFQVCIFTQMARTIPIDVTPLLLLLSFFDVIFFSASHATPDLTSDTISHTLRVRSRVNSNLFFSSCEVDDLARAIWQFKFNFFLSLFLSLSLLIRSAQNVRLYFCFSSMNRADPMMLMMEINDRIQVSKLAITAFTKRSLKIRSKLLQKFARLKTC